LSKHETALVIIQLQKIK